MVGLIAVEFLLFLVLSLARAGRHIIYSQSSVSVGSSCIHPAADEKYSEKNSRKFQKSKLEFAAH